jgi:hypothetical protein
MGTAPRKAGAAGNCRYIQFVFISPAIAGDESLPPEPVGGRARTSCYGFHPVTTTTGRFSNGLTQFVEGAITTAARRE